MTALERALSEPSLHFAGIQRARAASDSALQDFSGSTLQDFDECRRLKALAQKNILEKKDDALLWDRSRREVAIAQGFLAVVLVVGLYLGHVPLSTAASVFAGYIMVSAPLNPFFGYGLYKIRLCFEKKPRKIEE